MNSDCEFSEWSEWGSCSVTCEDGKQARNRRVAKVASKAIDTINCTGELTQSRICKNIPCNGTIFLLLWFIFCVCGIVLWGVIISLFHLVKHNYIVNVWLLRKTLGLYG